jgi:hypothetical protein
MRILRCALRAASPHRRPGPRLLCLRASPAMRPCERSALPHRPCAPDFPRRPHRRAPDPPLPHIPCAARSRLATATSRSTRSWTPRASPHAPRPRRAWAARRAGGAAATPWRSWRPRRWPPWGWAMRVRRGRGRGAAGWARVLGGAPCCRVTGLLGVWLWAAQARACPAPCAARAPPPGTSAAPARALPGFVSAGVYQQGGHEQDKQAGAKRPAPVAGTQLLTRLLGVRSCAVAGTHSPRLHEPPPCCPGRAANPEEIDLDADGEEGDGGGATGGGDGGAGDMEVSERAVPAGVFGSLAGLAGKAAPGAEPPAKKARA